MKIYDFLSKNSISRKRYALKFFVAVLPIIIIALAGPIIFIALGKTTIPVIITALILTILTITAIFLTLNIFGKLIYPLRLSKHALDNYLTSGQIPQLPVTYEDEAGALMSSIQSTINQLNTLVVEKSDMIDLLSHDLRSPVGRILSLSNLIKDETGPEKDLYADYIINECRGLLNMLENILLTLKEDSREFKVERINLKALITETTSFYDFAVTERGLNMDVTIDDSIYIFVQRQLFTQAVRNLLGNAIKFSPDGKTIHISGRQEEDRVYITIRDEGLGMAPDDVQKIFNRFTTAGKKGARGEASTGLGLYLSKKIIEKHSGKLTAESDGVNMGAAFTIMLYTLITKKPQDKGGRGPVVKKVLAVTRR